MRNVNDVEYLPFCKRSDNLLKIIDGNPLVTKETADGNRPQLTLVRSKFVSEKSERRERQASRDSARREAEDSKGSGTGLWEWCNNNQGFLTVIGLLAGACFFAGSFYSSWYMKSGLKEELREYIDSFVERSLAPIRGDVGRMAGDITKLQAGLANLQGRLGIITGIAYKEKASAFGLKDPQIVPIQLSDVGSSAIQVTGTYDDGTTFGLDFKVEALTQDSIKFLVNGVIRGDKLVDAGVILPRQVGVPVELDKIIEIPGLPKILLTILDLPTKDTVVVAVGEKSNPKYK